MPTPGIHTLDGFTAGGGFDNWVGVDQAPTLERYDMGSGDWTITTRLDFETVPFGAGYHTGLFFGFGDTADNDLVYWGEYTADGILAVERGGTGNQIRPTYTVDFGAVSLQVEKIGDEYHFRHRNDDSLDWVEDTVETTSMVSDKPVTRVGLIVKAYGGTAAPEVVADYDYFCLDVPDATLPTDVVTDPIPVVTAVGSLTCELMPDKSVALNFAACEGSTSDITVSVNGTVVDTLAPDATGTVLTPPFPGGTILHISVDNDLHSPVGCVVAQPLFESCDEFDDDPLAGDTWVFRTPRQVVDGPTLSVNDNPGFLRFHVPSSSTFDNWVGADFAPTLERYDMGDRDWTISTRFQYPDDFPAPGSTHHVGLMVGFGYGPPADAYNDMLYWGEYDNQTTLKIERTGAQVSAGIPYPGAPVSLQIQKAGNTLYFGHRQEDTDPWTTDYVYDIVLPYPTNAAASPPAGTPVSRVGLVIKTWGAVDTTPDFDYFCLTVTDSPPEPVIQNDAGRRDGPLRRDLLREQLGRPERRDAELPLGLRRWRDVGRRRPGAHLHSGGPEDGHPHGDR